MSLARLTVTELLGSYRNNETTPVDVVEELIATIDARDAGVAAYLDVYREQALADARAMTASGAYLGRPLGGVPVALKDNICVVGRRTTCASKILANYESPYDATAVARLRDAGAILIGKTNLDEFAMGSSTENSGFGPTRNPWDTTRTPGGSSGGSAAAVAADMAFAALGSDTGGSIRQPAGLCGVVGVKPTYGRVSRYGLVAFASSLDQVGPIAKTVTDAATVLGAISGKCARDATSLEAAVPDFAADLDRGFGGLTVGVPRAFVGDDVDAAVRDNFEEVVGRVKDAGGTVRDVALPNADYGLAAYYIIANAEASANLARYDGVRYGRRAGAPKNLYDLVARSRAEGFGAEVKRRILLGTHVLSEGYTDAYYHKAQQVRSLIIRDFDAAFQGCDVIMLPTSPTPAFALGERTDDPIQMYLADVFTIPANLAGLPAVSVPSGLTESRLPLGVQVIGKALDEPTVLRAARGIEQLVNFKERALG